LLAADVFLIVATERVSVGVAAGPWIASAMLLVFGIGVIWGGARVGSDHT
jgi:multidrug transporter EmrE-like cation transporter